MKNGITQEIIKLVRRCDLNSLKNILEKSTVSEINIKEKGMGYSLLTSAVSLVQPEVVKLLLSYGADPESEARSKVEIFEEQI